MPEISTFLKKERAPSKKKTSSSDWDMSTFIQPKQATTPQRRPGRGDDTPKLIADQPNLTVSETKTASNKLTDLALAAMENRQQTDNKPEPKLGQSAAKVEPEQVLTAVLPNQQEEKLRTEVRPQAEPKLGQSAAKVEPNQPLSALVGLQRNILFYIYASCRAEGSKISAPISIENLSNSAKTTVQAARKAVQRLEGKRFIIRAQYKDGRGGWTQYAILDTTYNALLLDETRAKVEPNLGQTRAKVETEVGPQLRPSLSSSSSFLELENLKTTTTEESEFFSTELRLSPEWQTLDVTPLNEIGFTQTHLIQIIRQGKLSPVEVQDSIQFFSFDLKRNGKGRELSGSPLNFFMGILRKGIPYAPPENFESPADEVRRKIREFKERKERERQTEEQKIIELEFSEWRRGLGPDDILQIVPEFARKPGPLQDSTLKAHFDAQIWPHRAQEALGLTKIAGSDIVQQIQASLGEVER